jgi:hypothetical protein
MFVIELLEILLLRSHQTKLLVPLAVGVKEPSTCDCDTVTHSHI